MLVLLMVQKSAPVEVGTFFPFYPIIYRVFFLISKKKVDFFLGLEFLKHGTTSPHLAALLEVP